MARDEQIGPIATPRFRPTNISAERDAIHRTTAYIEFFSSRSNA